MLGTILTILAQEGEANDPADLYPHVEELIVGAIAFAVLFVFMVKWVLPRLSQVLEARREKIQGEMERAEETRREADQILQEYRQQIANARDEANQVIEEARRTAEQLRKDIAERAEREAESTVARAQEEIRAERDRVVQELRAQVGALSIQLAERVVGASLDTARHRKLVDEYIEQVAGTAANGNGNGKKAK